MALNGVRADGPEDSRKVFFLQVNLYQSILLSWHVTDSAFSDIDNCLYPKSASKHPNIASQIMLC